MPYVPEGLSTEPNMGAESVGQTSGMHWSEPAHSPDALHVKATDDPE